MTLLHKILGFRVVFALLFLAPYVIASFFSVHVAYPDTLRIYKHDTQTLALCMRHDDVFKCTFDELQVDVRINDSYIFADTYEIWINNALQAVCYFVDDVVTYNDHLFDIAVIAQSYQILAASQSVCTKTD